MLGKTHMAVGIATTLAVIPPENTRQLLLEVGAGAVGALISDIDVGTSESHRDADVITYLTLGVVAVVIALDHFMNVSDYHIEKAYVFSIGNVEKDGNVTYLPIYMCYLVKEQSIGQLIVDLDMEGL